MTEQETIKELERHIQFLRESWKPHPDYNVIESLGIAIKSLEKQIAKKPIEVDEQIDNCFYYLAFMCPSCGGSVTGQPYRPDYCKHCGQKLDWSEV